MDRVNKRRRRWLFPAQGWSAATTLGSKLKVDETLKAFALKMNHFRVESMLSVDPRFVAALPTLG
jgi:hypothetical protein